MSAEPDDALPTEPDLPTELLPTVAEAEVWLSRVKPGAVLALLKEPKFGAVVGRAFLGFRADAKAFSNPLVRSRLAQSAAKDAQIADKLRELADTQPKAGLPPAQPRPPETLPPPPDPLPALRAERDTRRRERDAARQELAAAVSERDAAVKARVELEAERDAAVRLAKSQTERIARLERQTARARQTEAHLVKALNEDKVSAPTPRPRTAGTLSGGASKPSESPWLLAVQHQLDKGKWTAAQTLAEDVLKADAEDTDALEIALRAAEGLREPRLALGFARRLLALQVRRTDFPAASETVLTLFRLVSSPGSAEPEIRALLMALPPNDSAAVSALRLMLGRLQSASPDAYDWLLAYVSAKTALGPTLMPPPGALGPDDPLPLGKVLKLGRSITARTLTDAVDRAQVALVDAARAALAALPPEQSARVWAALESAASDAPARLLPLRRAPRGAAVVDGSNVAWFDQESLAHGKPRLRHLLALRRTLWAKGIFPVVLYADANLPYFIDDKTALRAMRDREELTFVDAGTVADEVLLRVAKSLGAALITNDRMEDWDPENTVRKVRYTISPSGEALLLSEI